MIKNEDFLSDSELEDIRSRWLKTTAGPWKSLIEGRDHTSGSSFIMTGTDLNRGPDIEPIGATSEDQDFIASAHQDIPRLLDEIMRLKKESLAKRH